MRVLERILKGIILSLLALMIVLVAVQVLNRYGTRLSLPWTEELTRTAYVLLIFFGSTLAVLECRHVRVLSGVKKLPRRVRRWLAAFACLASAVFFVYVAYGNYVYMVVNLDAVFTTMQWLNIGYLLGAVLVSSILSAALFLYRAVRPCADDDDVAEDSAG